MRGQNYLDENKKYWEKGYDAPCVESHVFRPFNQIIKEYMPSEHVKTLDWGCGQGATALYFNSLGMDVYGIDISQKDIDICRNKFSSEIKDHFLCVDSKPVKDNIRFGGNFHLITAIQSLYYLNDDDFLVEIDNIFNMLKENGIIYATMMAPEHYILENSKPLDQGIYSCNFKSKHYYVNPTFSEEHLIEKFSLFEPLHIGFYSHKYFSYQNSSCHLTYIGQKKSRACS